MLSNKHIFIIGWYGTETVGDKAILGGIVKKYHADNQEVEFKVGSIYPYITKYTIQELGIIAKVINVKSAEFFRALFWADEIVMGGGPLMDLEELWIPLWAFMIASIFNKRCVIFGCGIGPLNERKYINSVKHILKLATIIKLRDKDSVQTARQLSGRNDIQKINDPATDYVLYRKRILKKRFETNKILACYLRDLPRIYTEYEKQELYSEKKEDFEDHLAKFLIDIAQKHDLRIRFFPMHTFIVGNDDRNFYRRFIRKFHSSIDADWMGKTTSVEDIITAMLRAKINICMRFHSVLFAHTLDTNFLAIDYTNGGKVASFMGEKKLTTHMLSIEQIANGNFGEWYKMVAQFCYENTNYKYKRQ